MAFGRTPGLMIRIRDAATAQELVGGSLRFVFMDTGEDMTRSYNPDFGFFSAEHIKVDGQGRVVLDEDGHPQGEATPFGRYQIIVDEPGRFSDSEVADHVAPDRPVEFTFGEDSIGSIDVYCSAIPADELAIADNDDGGGKRRGRRSLRRRWADWQAAFVPRALPVAFALGAVAAGLITALAIVPALFMTIYGLTCLADPTLGPAWGLSNLKWYVTSGYIPCGWPAVRVFTELVGPVILPPLVTAGLVSLPLFWWAYWSAGKAIEDKMIVRSDLLDKLPPPAGSTSYGSGALVRSLDTIRDELPTYNPSDPDGPEFGGVFVGFVDGPLWRTAWLKTRDELRLAAWHGRMLLRRGKPAESVDIFGEVRDLDPRPAPSAATKEYVMLPDFLNTLLLGDTRAGKTRRILLATIDLLAQSGESALIIDPKGELYALTHELCRRYYGAENVTRIDFRCVDKSSGWNPMQGVVDAAGAGRSGAYRRDSQGRVLGDYDAMTTAAKTFATTMLPPENDVGNGKYFNDGARAIIPSVMCYVASVQSGCPENERSLTTVSNIIDRYVRPRAIPGGRTEEMWCPYKEMLKKLPHDHPAVSLWATVDGAKPNDLSSFATTSQTVLQDFRDSNVASMTSHTDVPLARLGKVPSVTFAIIPHEKPTYGRLATLFLQQSYQALVDEGVRNGVEGKLPVRVTMLCEELGQIPPIPSLSSKLNVSLGSNIRWLLIFQSCAQMIRQYEDAPAKEIFGACGYKILLKTQDSQITGQWIQSDLGDYDVEVKSISRQRGPLGIPSISTSETVSIAKRPVMTPNEVGEWTADVGSLVIVGGTKGPYVVPLPDVSQTPTGAAIGINDHAHVAKLYSEAFGGGLASFNEAMAWDPCLGQKDPTRAYTEDDFKAADERYIAELMASHKGKKKTSGKDSSSKREEGIAFLAIDGSSVDGPFAVPTDIETRAKWLATMRKAHPPAEWIEHGADSHREGSFKSLGVVAREAEQKRASLAASWPGRKERMENDAKNASRGTSPNATESKEE